MALIHAARGLCSAAAASFQQLASSGHGGGVHGMAVFFECKRDFYETLETATLTILAKGVPGESHVQYKMDGQAMLAAIQVPGRGTCQFRVDLPAPVSNVTVVVSPSRLKVEFKLVKEAPSMWHTPGGFMMTDSTEPPEEPARKGLGALTKTSSPGVNTAGCPLVGLKNMGNTCFMNSVLQMLNCVGEMVVYFRGGLYERDVNKENFLGSKGELATVYADLVQHMTVQGQKVGGFNRDAKHRAGQAATVTPRIVQRLFRTFVHSRQDSVGGSQSDAMEFLVYLLDGLHEDLQRVREKPKYRLRGSSSVPLGVVT